MIINVLGELIDTDHIYRITAIMHDYYNSRMSAFYFKIFFKDGASAMDVKLYGDNLYRDARIKWSEANEELLETRLAILKEKVNLLRHQIIKHWIQDQPDVHELTFDVSIPMIDLRKDGVSIIKPSSFSPMSSGPSFRSRGFAASVFGV